MSDEKVVNQGERTRFVVELPYYTNQRLEALLEKTGMTKTQLMIMMVDQVYSGVVEQDGQAA